MTETKTNPDFFAFEKKIGCFEELNEEEINFLSSNAAEITFKKGEIIAKQGAFATHLMYIKKGFVKLYMEGKTSNFILNFYSKDKLIGVSSLLGATNFNYSVCAVDNSLICFIEINAVKQVLNQNIKFVNSLLKRSNKNSLFSYSRIFTLSQKQLVGKLAEALMHLAKEVFKSKKFSLTISRKELAEFTGMSVMSVIRVLNTFKKEHIIAEKDGLIEILDFEALEKYYRFG